MKMIKVP